MPLEKFTELATPYIRQTVKKADADMTLIASVLQPRTEVFTDIPEQVDFIDQLPEYDTAMYCHKKMKTNEETSLEALTKVLPIIENITDWTIENIHETVFSFIKELEVKNGYMLWPLRTALSGKQFTPGKNKKRYREIILILSSFCHITLIEYNRHK